MPDDLDGLMTCSSPQSEAAAQDGSSTANNRARPTQQLWVSSRKTAAKQLADEVRQKLRGELPRPAVQSSVSSTATAAAAANSKAQQDSKREAKKGKAAKAAATDKLDTSAWPGLPAEACARPQMEKSVWPRAAAPQQSRVDGQAATAAKPETQPAVALDAAWPSLHSCTASQQETGGDALHPNVAPQPKWPKNTPQLSQSAAPIAPAQIVAPANGHAAVPPQWSKNVPTVLPQPEVPKPKSAALATAGPVPLARPRPKPMMSILPSLSSLEISGSTAAVNDEVNSKATVSCPPQAVQPTRLNVGRQSCSDSGELLVTPLQH